MKSLGRCIIAARRSFPGRPLVLFKTDVSQAYRRLPLHPIWQLKQVVTIDGERMIDRNPCFGGRSNCRLWCYFFSLVLWGAIHVKHIADLLVYIDDVFSWDFADNLLFYPPYKKSFPAKQTRLLELFDSLGIPHECPKQVFGETLVVIGFEVSIPQLRISIPDSKRTELLDAIRTFIPSSRNNRKRSLREFQRLAGWINWALNVYPLLRPGLSALYAKMAGKSRPHESIWVNEAVIRELEWLCSYLELPSGILLLDAVPWDSNEADLVVLTDACLKGLGVWFPSMNRGLRCPIPANAPVGWIYLFELCAIFAAIDWLITEGFSDCRIALFSDNSNCVDAFNSLSSPHPYNIVLRACIDRLLSNNIRLRVFHIPGSENVVADLLSRDRAPEVLLRIPNIQIASFSPSALFPNKR
jgi:hypothetical protein